MKPGTKLPDVSGHTIRDVLALLILVAALTFAFSGCVAEDSGGQSESMAEVGATPDPASQAPEPVESHPFEVNGDSFRVAVESLSGAPITDEVRQAAALELHVEATPTAAPTPEATPTPTPTPTPPPNVITVGVEAVHLQPWQMAALSFFGESDRPAMYAIGCAESGWNPYAHHHNPPTEETPEGSTDWNVFQLNDYYWGKIFEQRGLTLWRKDAQQNARGAAIVLKSQGKDGWVTWKTYANGDPATLLTHARSIGLCVAQ